MFDEYRVNNEYGKASRSSFKVEDTCRRELFIYVIILLADR